MPKFFVNKDQINEDNINIIGEDVNHIKNVLRKKVDDEIVICNVDEKKDYLSKIYCLTEKSIECKIIQELNLNTESNIKVTILQGLPKSDKMELVIQKSVELGVFNIIPTEMKRCVVKLNEKEKNKKVQRWQKISEVAAKQSGRGIIPKIENIESLKNICSLCKNYDIVLVAYENEKNNTLKNELTKLKNKLNLSKNINIAVLIGPEGRNR